MVSQQYRHRAGARTVQRLIGEGAVGRIGAVYISFFQDPPPPGFQFAMDEPLLVDMAVHHFDLIRGILGIEPATVLARSSNPSWSALGGNASATVVLETADGVPVTYTGSWAPRGRTTGWDGIWEIHGEEGSIRWQGDSVVLGPLEWPPLAKLMRRALGREWRGRRIDAAAVSEADRLGSLAEFSSAIREQREPETSARDNLRSLALTLAAVESARRGGAVDVDELLSAQQTH
jgi:predicted dehydrogenase